MYFHYNGQAVVSHADFTCVSSQSVIFMFVIYIALQQRQHLEMGLDFMPM